MKHTLRTLAFAFFMFLAPHAHAADKLPVVASFSILGDIVQNIGGDDITLSTIAGPGTNMHAYTPTPADARTMAGASIVFVAGLGFDSSIEKIARAAGPNVMVINASEGLSARTITEEEDAHEDHHHHDAPDGLNIDPHAWNDVSNVRHYVRNIAAALAARMPERADQIVARAESYDAKLAALDTDIRKQMLKIPAAKRKIITAHDAFGYFGAAYGVQMLSAEGVHGSAPSAAQIAALMQQMKTQHIDTVFLENAGNAKLMQQIAADTDAKIGGQLYPGTLSGPQGPAPDYISLMHHNVRLMIKAMQ